MVYSIDSIGILTIACHTACAIVDGQCCLNSNYGKLRIALFIAN